MDRIVFIPDNGAESIALPGGGEHRLLFMLLVRVAAMKRTNEIYGGGKKYNLPMVQVGK
jgi:hypothetical protein